MDYQPFKARITVHNNEHIRVRVSLLPPDGEVVPDISGWQFQAPTRQADESKVFAGVLVDDVNKTVLIDVNPGTELGPCQVDLLTDFGGGGPSWFRLGSVFATVKEGAGQHD